MTSSWLKNNRKGSKDIDKVENAFEPIIRFSSY